MTTRSVGINKPFFHFGSGNVNTVSLATTTHGKEDIKIGDTEALIARGNRVECGRVVEHMVVEGEFTAEAIRSETNHAIGWSIAYLGMKSTPLSFMDCQLNFLVSAATFWSSSALDFPAQ